MSAFWNPNAEGEDEDDEEDSATTSWRGRDGVIFLIDASASITGDDEQFRTCLECIEVTMMNRIICSERDLIGVVFYNTEHSPEPKDENELDVKLVAPKHTAIFMPLKTMNKESILYFKNFKNSSDFFDFENRYGTSISSNFSESLWLCSRMFMRCGYKLQSSTIVLFTNNTLPHVPGSHDFQKSFVRAKDLLELQVQFMLVPMIDDFDVTLFYREFICMVRNEDPETFRFLSPEQQRENLLNRIFQRDYRKACLRYFTLTLGENMSISCGLYSLKKVSHIPKTIHLVRDTNQVVVAKRTYVVGAYDDELMDYKYDRRLLPGEQKKVLEVGGQKIMFTTEELAKIKSLVPPGMKLLGFKPLSTLPKRCFVKSTRFLYPNENTVKGSTTLFRALWKKCIEKEKYAMCVFAQMRKVAPRYIALVPQQEIPDGSDGFRVVYLPMQTDIRKLDVFDQSPPEVPPEGLDVFKSIVKKLKFKYNPNLFENPYLRMFYANLEALVFEEAGTEMEDITLPDTDCQDAKIGELVNELSEIFGKDCAVAPKRGASNQANGRSSKLPKLSNVSKDDVTSAILTGATSKLTVVTLREFLQAEGVQGVSKLNKGALIDKIKQHCNL